MSTDALAGADFIIGVKGNQQTLLDEREVAFHDAHLAHLKIDEHTTQERGHERGERRVCQVLCAEANLTATDKWHGIETLIRITSERFVDGAPSENIRFYVSSRELTDQRTAKQALTLVRAHWGIENRMHWCLDTQFGRGPQSDRRSPRSRKPRRCSTPGPQPPTRSVLPIGRDQGRGGIKARRMQCAVNDSARVKVLAGG